MIHIFIGLLACQYHKSTNVQIRRLKTTIQSALSHSVGLAIGSYIASVAVILMYVYIYNNSGDKMLTRNRLTICFRKRGGNLDLVTQSNDAWLGWIPKMTKYWFLSNLHAHHDLPAWVNEPRWTTTLDQYIACF